MFLFKMWLEKGMVHWQTHLTPSSQDVNSSQAAAVWSDKLAQASGWTSWASLDFCLAVTSFLLEFLCSCCAAIKH